MLPRHINTYLLCLVTYEDDLGMLYKRHQRN